jgi:hypothetical protein
VQEGYKIHFDGALATVWSAPNYCYRCGNAASILTIGADGTREWTVFDAAPENERDRGMGMRRMASATCPIGRFLRVDEWADLCVGCDAVLRLRGRFVNRCRCTYSIGHGSTYLSCPGAHVTRLADERSGRFLTGAIPLHIQRSPLREGGRHGMHCLRSCARLIASTDTSCPYSATTWKTLTMRPTSDKPSCHCLWLDTPIGISHRLKGSSPWPA